MLEKDEALDEIHQIYIPLDLWNPVWKPRKALFHSGIRAENTARAKRQARTHESEISQFFQLEKFEKEGDPSDSSVGARGAAARTSDHAVRSLDSFSVNRPSRWNGHMGALPPSKMHLPCGSPWA